MLRKLEAIPQHQQTYGDHVAAGRAYQRSIDAQVAARIREIERGY